MGDSIYVGSAAKARVKKRIMAGIKGIKEVNKKTFKREHDVSYARDEWRRKVTKKIFADIILWISETKSDLKIDLKNVVDAYDKPTELRDFMIDPLAIVFERNAASETWLGDALFYGFYGISPIFAEYESEELGGIDTSSIYELRKISHVETEREAVSRSKLTISSKPYGSAHLWLYRQEKQFKYSNSNDQFSLLAKGVIQRSASKQLLFIGQQLLMREGHCYSKSDQLMYFNIPKDMPSGIDKVQGIELRVLDEKPTSQLVVLEKRKDTDFETGIEEILKKTDRPEELHHKGDWSKIVANTKDIISTQS